jgi:transcriptional regulator with XRE-family HTH domain
MDAESVERRARLEAWQKRLSDQTVTEILRYRDLRGLTNDELRRRLGNLGWDLTRDSLASILSAKRKSMPVTDVLLFAHALNVPPAALVFPTSTNEPTPLWPGDEPKLYAYKDVQWFSGSFGDHGASNVAAPEDATIDEYYDIGDIVSRLEEIDDSERHAYYANFNLFLDWAADEDRARIREDLEGHLTDIAYLRNFLSKVHKGIRLPTLHPALAFLDERNYVIPPLPIEAFKEHPLYGKSLSVERENAAIAEEIRRSETAHGAPADAP